MKRAAKALFAAVLAAFSFALPAAAQFPANMPPNTVYGRSGISTGPGQAIPFSVIVQTLNNNPNIWTALQTFNGGIASNGLLSCTIPIALGKCFNFSQVAIGGTTGVPVNLNQMLVQEGISAGANFVNALGFINNITGGNGGRQTFQISTNIFNTSTWSALTNQFFVSFEASIMAQTNVGGVSTSAPAGAMFAYNPECFLKSGATFWAQITCQETDVDVETGASVAYLAGMSIVQQASHSQQGFRQDAAFVFTNFLGAAGWQCLICAGSFGEAESPFGQVSPNGATYIGLFAPGGGHAAPFFKFGVDFVLANPTGTDLSGGFPFRSGVAGVTNFSVDWNGLIIASSFAEPGSSSGIISFKTQAAAGTFNWNWPVTAGSAGNVLASGGGGTNPMTWINGVTTVCTVTVGNSLTFTNGVLTTKGANCT